MADNGYAAEMHISDPSVGFAGADGMIGPGHVIATGSAFDFRARGSDQVSVVFGGDGTYATPHFHSALNNAALLKLPFIYVLENNLYHQYAHYSYSCPMKDLAAAAEPYGITGVVVDGQDVIQVYNAAKTPGFAGQHSDYKIDTYYARIPGVKTVIPSTPFGAKGHRFFDNPMRQDKEPDHRAVQTHHRMI